MQFLQLYGDELDRELGTEDRVQRFTIPRRKAAINAGQLEFIKRTECLSRRGSLALVSGTAEYDLDVAFPDYGWLAKPGIKVSITSGAQTRFIEGDDLELISTERLDQEQPGWQGWSASTPQFAYFRRDGGTLMLGFAPAPSIPVTNVWTALVHFVVVPTEMVGDGDEPFSGIGSLAFYHRACVFYAAADLEKLRKDPQRTAMEMQLFEGEVQKYVVSQKPPGGQPVRMAVNYRGRARGGGRVMDPRVYP